jgi:hypothetical protein
MAKQNKTNYLYKAWSIFLIFFEQQRVKKISQFGFVQQQQQQKKKIKRWSFFV